ncbi:MAG: hypothetical protein KF799_08795 [Bdellovibrionales bacterium]|nr:hypothetical protein [Bdellovibrionales bacterium]
MKACVFTALFLFTLNGFAAQHSQSASLKLVSLKPKKVAPRQLGRVSATLIKTSDDEVVDRISTTFGDCANCARGIAVRGVLGIRLEGKSITTLQITKKSTPGVRYHDCKQLELPKGGEYQCTFSFRETMYTVKLKGTSFLSGMRRDIE